MKRIIVSLILLVVLSCRVASAAPQVYRVAGVQFSLGMAFSQPQALKSGASSLGYPSAKNPSMELIVSRVPAATARKLGKGLLAQQKSALLGVSQPGQWSTQSTILGHDITVDGQQWKGGAVQTCVVPLGNGDQLFLALRTSAAAQKGEPEAVWSTLTDSLKQAP